MSQVEATVCIFSQLQFHGRYDLPQLFFQVADLQESGIFSQHGPAYLPSQSHPVLSKLLHFGFHFLHAYLLMGEMLLFQIYFSLKIESSVLQFLHYLLRYSVYFHQVQSQQRSHIPYLL